ncbi:unnamed protein product [Spirodela intermedia]|uniref:Bifunctional inhibitor/plant lipid transfer protein/seed storage helical domain-containing protein n=1 Tax=Spirodela intermedia TaxID=51605 RepID=A0A7I8JYN9_SPIIN|nr:unnamed protein product [Spirodela intermedia]
MDRMVLCVGFLVLMASFRGGARAQSPSPASSPPKKAPAAPPPLAVPPEKPCSKVILQSLAPCLSYVTTPKGGRTKPSPDCCDSLRKFLDDRPKCLCFLIDSNSTFPIAVDRGQALNLPNACNATIPPIDRCLRPGPTAPSPAPPPSNAANPSLVPSAAAFLAGISLAIVAAFL